MQAVKVVLEVRQADTCTLDLVLLLGFDVHSEADDGAASQAG